MNNKQKSKEYWEKRAIENENKVYAKGSEVKKALEEHYLKAKKEIRKSISELVARYMDKTELSYIEAVTYLTSSEFKEWRMTLEEYEEEIKRLEKISPEFARKLRIELETLATKSRITRLESLNTQIDMELAKKSIKDYDVVRDGVSKTYSDFFKIQTTEFGLDGANTVLPKKTIEMLMQQPWSGSNFSERIWDNSSALARVLKQEIIQAFMQGVSVKDLSDRIEKRFENDRYNTERLVRTELNYALNQSTKLSYDEAGIKEYEFLAEIDSRTSDICRELNGQIFKMKDARTGVNYPPMHPHCRSTTIPVMNYEDIKTRKTKSKKEKTEPIKSDILKEKGELYGLNKKLPRKEFAQKLLSNLELNHLEVTIKSMDARGSCGLGLEPINSEKSKLLVKTYNLEKDDNRSKYYQLKTAFHEAYHALGHNKEVDFVYSKEQFIKWAYMDDVFAECSAHYMMKKLGNKIPISPSYPSYLAETLPKLKKIEKFKNCKTIEDFGEIAWKEKIAGKNPTWISLKKELDKINVEENYYKKYLDYARNNKNKIKTLIKRNSPDIKMEAIERNVETALDKGEVNSKISQLIIANVMKLKGVI